ncbi:MAG: sigma-54-dependent Fis family transcriptional regulator [bacterium]|nr:sigma-54-dependent Fis family transcriptional regulator [bacterium]
MARILVVDDEQKMVTLLQGALKHQGHEVEGVFGGREALDLVDVGHFDVVVTDLRMEPVDGMAVLAGVRERSPGTQVIVLTAYGEVKTAIAALQGGAFQYLTKPVNFQEVSHVVDQALAGRDRDRENHALRKAVASLTGHQVLVGESPATQTLRSVIARVAPSDATVLIRGESGTGKEITARAIHVASSRSTAPFVAVNCAAIAETLLESELFGYRKGAFTGADTDREGLFEAAQGGTLFLDEIGEAGPGVQAKLLRVLEEKRINRVGDPVERRVDVRVVAATNRPLESAIAEKTFREDLYYRLLVFPIDVPPLRDRTEDVDLLADHFLAQYGRPEEHLPPATLDRLRAYSWPGNVRELRNLVERAHILAGDGPIGDRDVIVDVTGVRPERSPAAVGEDLNLDNNARLLITAALDRASGNKSLAARMLGITRRTLYSRLKLLGMEEE